MFAHRSFARNVRGSAFLLAMVALVTLMFLGTSLVEVSIHGLARATKDTRGAQALALAEAGADMVLEKLYDDYGGINATLNSTGTYSSSFTLPEGAVQYTVTAPFNGIANTCEIRSTATTSMNQTETIRMIGSYIVDVSRVFRGAIFSDSPLKMNGDYSVIPDASGNGSEIYAHGNIDFNGQSGSMDVAGEARGNIYTTGVTVGAPGSGVAHVYQHIAPIPMPVIDLNYYKSIATRIYNAPKSGLKMGTGGSVSLSGLTGVIFVNGDVSISGQYSGSALIVATGKINVTGSVTTSNPDTESRGGRSPQTIKLAGNSTIDGLVYAHGVTVADVAAGGNVTVVGAICADVVTTNGGITVQYSDVWKDLGTPGSGKSQWAKVSWEELHL